MKKTIIIGLCMIILLSVFVNARVQEKHVKIHLTPYNIYYGTHWMYYGGYEGWSCYFHPCGNVGPNANQICDNYDYTYSGYALDPNNNRVSLSSTSTFNAFAPGCRPNCAGTTGVWTLICEEKTCDCDVQGCVDRINSPGLACNGCDWQQDCSCIPTGWVTNNQDCDDKDENQKQGATEICNGEDDNCDGSLMSNEYTYSTGTEVCGNSLDDDCDGQVDEGCIIEITNCIELQNMKNDLNADYIIMNDIDCSDTVNWNGGAGFDPIGTQSTPFTGSLDGNDYRIYNLKAVRPTFYSEGLIGYASNAKGVHNVGLENVNIEGYRFVGGLIGYSDGITSITNSYVTGTVKANNRVGGLVGEFATGIIDGCHSEATVISSADAGGLVAKIGGRIIDSYATGDVNGVWSVGGLVGTIYSGIGDKGIQRSYATGDVSGNNMVGGLCGSASASIDDSFATGNVNGLDVASISIGGLVGSNSMGAPISNSYSIGAVSGTSEVGGLVGFPTPAPVTNSYYNLETSGQNDNDGRGIPKTTAEMKQLLTYNNWDYCNQGGNIWAIQEGASYPCLNWENTGCTCGITCVDNDGDGYTDEGCGGDDCNEDPLDSDWPGVFINPGQIEVCGNSIDDDCDGEIDEDCCDCTGTSCKDVVNEPWIKCDGCNYVYSYIEICSNGKDDNCDGRTDEYWPELKNGYDDNCNGQVDEGCLPNYKAICPTYPVYFCSGTDCQNYCGAVSCIVQTWIS